MENYGKSRKMMENDGKLPRLVVLLNAFLQMFGGITLQVGHHPLAPKKNGSSPRDTGCRSKLLPWSVSACQPMLVDAT